MASTGEAFGLFWDSENGDRTYSAASFEYWLKKFFTSGVFNGDLQVKATSGMTLEVEAGYTNADGKVKFWNAPFNVTLDAANSTYPRIDTVVIRRDNVNRQITCEKVTGAYSGDTPQPTAPTRNSEIYELVIAQIYVGAGVTGITQSNITDTRPNNELCGYITGTVEELDFSAFTAQFEAYFAEFKRNQMADFQAWEVAQQAAYAAWFNLVQQQQVQDKADWDAWYAALQEELHELPADTAEYLQIEIDEIRTSGTTGSILKISTTETSLEGKTVTVTNGTETRTATFDENLECLIAGYKGTGEVTISSSDGIQTASTVVTIPYFGNYTYNIAFWAATVNIQGDDNLKGATITVKDSDDLTVGTVVLNVITGRGVFTAQKADTYTFNFTYQGTDYSEELVVDEQITYSLSLSAGFSWQTWVDTARFLDSSDYANLGEVLADEEAVRELCLEHNCVDYLADIATANEDVETIINNDLFAKWVNNSDYALDFLGANVVVKALMDEADKYFYGEWALMPQVPTMTSNSAPYGTVSAKNYRTYGSTYNYPYLAFDEDSSTSWQSSDGSDTDTWLQYQFTSPIIPKKCEILTRGANRSLIFNLLGSNDGTNFTPILSGAESASEEVVHSYEINNDTAYSYIKLVPTQANITGTSARVAISSLQFYAWQPKGNVPVMTSNTAPYGVASASTEYNSSYAAYMAFDGDENTRWSSSTSVTSGNITYKFSNPVCAKKVRVRNGNLREVTYTITGSNDGSTWSNALVTHVHPSGGEEDITLEMNNDNYYLYYRYSFTVASGGDTLWALQFYGRELSVSVPKMTSNNAPYGVVSASTQLASETATMYAFRAFDGDKSNSATNYYWQPNINENNSWIKYRFNAPTKVDLMTLYIRAYQTSGSRSFKLEASDDDITYETLIDSFTVIGLSTAASYNLVSKTVDVPTTKAYRYYKLSCIGVFVSSNSTNVAQMKEIEMFGLDYSEKEFEEGATKKWLYDHGVELETLTALTVGSGSVATKNNSNVYVEVAGTAQTGAYLYKQLDLTNYDLLRGKVDDMFYASSASYGPAWLSVFSQTPNPSNTGLVASVTPLMGDNNLPDNLAIDISGIDANDYVSFCSGNANGTIAKHATFNELWLE